MQTEPFHRREPTSNPPRWFEDTWHREVPVRPGYVVKPLEASKAVDHDRCVGQVQGQ